MCDENLIMYIFRWKKIITKSHGTKKISMTHETIPNFPNNSEFVSMYLEKRWHRPRAISELIRMKNERKTVDKV